jgi:hypothetical protein
MCSQPLDPSASPATLLVVCLCAQWCGVCGEYRSRFDQVKATVQAADPMAQFFWIDVEDEADLLHPLDVEDFPTLLIAVGTEPCFLGPIEPQAATLERLIRAHRVTAASARLGAQASALVGRIRAAKSS